MRSSRFRSIPCPDAPLPSPRRIAGSSWEEKRHASAPWEPLWPSSPADPRSARRPLFSASCLKLVDAFCTLGWGQGTGRPSTAPSLLRKVPLCLLNPPWPFGPNQTLSARAQPIVLGRCHSWCLALCCPPCISVFDTPAKLDLFCAEPETKPTRPMRTTPCPSTHITRHSAHPAMPFLNSNSSP